MKKLSVMTSGYVLTVLFSPLCLAAPQTRPSPAPATRPAAAPKADSATDWLLGQAAAAPSTPNESDDKPPASTSRPASPFAAAGSAIAADVPARQGVIGLSNGEKIRAKFATTRDKPLRIYDEHEVFRHIPFNLVKSAEAKVLWERDEKE